MNININGINIIEKIEDIDFSNIEIGNQFLIIKKVKDDINEKTKLLLYVVDNIESNFIDFTCNYIEHDIIIDEYDKKQVEIDNGQSDLRILLINNEALKIPNCSYGVINENNELMYKLYNRMFEYNLPGFRYDYSYEDLNKFNFTFFCSINEDIRFAYVCNNNLQDYEWDVREHFYIINKFKECFEISGIDINKLFNSLKNLGCNSIMDDFKEFKQAYKIIHYDIENYLSDKSILDEIKHFYSKIPELSGKINKFFEPIYVADGFKGYLDSRYNLSYSCSIPLYESDLTDDQKIKINKRITEQIKNKLIGRLDINPYTGEILNDIYKNIYEDSEHLVIQSKHNPVDKQYFIKFNGIYVIANYNEKNEIKELMETINILLG